MIPKQKAKELMFLFSNKIQKYDTILYQKKLSKKCALIAVDEILNVLWHTHKNEDTWKYYLEVKQEIEKL
jgi:hypothetical protein